MKLSNVCHTTHSPANARPAFMSLGYDLPTVPADVAVECSGLPRRATGEKTNYPVKQHTLKRVELQRTRNALMARRPQEKVAILD